MIKKYYLMLGGLFLAAVTYRYICHSLMLIPVLYNELIPSSHMPDLMLDTIPYVGWIAKYNYQLWILCYIPLAIFMFLKAPDLFFKFIVIGGIVSLVRGLCIPLTTLGPCFGEDLNPTRSFDIWRVWLAIVNPFTAIGQESAAQIYLTKDMFFSGHVSSTFLLYLYSRKLGRISWLYFVANITIVAVVFLAHLHYTIDVVGAYAITYSIFKILGPYTDKKIKFAFISKHYVFPLRFTRA